MIRARMLGVMFLPLFASVAAAGPVGVVITSKSAAVTGTGGAASAGQVYGAVARAGFHVQIVFNGSAGWVAVSDIAESGPVSAVALTRDALVRTGPGTVFAVFGTGLAGQTYASLSSGGGYVEITFGGASGYVAEGSVVNDVLGGSLRDLGDSDVAVHARFFHMGFPDDGIVDPLQNLSPITSAPPPAAPAATPPQYTTAGNDPRQSYTTGGADPPTPSGGGGGGGCFAGGASSGSGIALLAGALAALLARRRR